MATLREYFELDFPTTAIFRYKLEAQASNDPALAFTIFAQAHVDFDAHIKFCSFYIPETAQQFIDVAKAVLQYSRDVLALSRPFHITLPKLSQASAGTQIQLINGEFLGVKLIPLEGIPYEVKDFAIAPPIYIYFEQELSQEEATQVVEIGRNYNATVRLRGPAYAKERLTKEKPLAFISHDSRDKDDVARPLALGLSRLGCHVWFDEFTLKPGDRLRESIEKGIKDCKKCILVLTPNFLSNKGLGTTEFNSIFTREIIEEQSLVIPVWAGVSKQQVFEYSPSLLNILGVHFDPANSELCIRSIVRALDA